MFATPDSFYLTDPEMLIWVFDQRQPGSAEMLDRECALWPRHTEVEVLDQVHVAVICRPGWVSEAAA